MARAIGGRRPAGHAGRLAGKFAVKLGVVGHAAVSAGLSALHWNLLVVGVQCPGPAGRLVGEFATKLGVDVPAVASAGLLLCEQCAAECAELLTAIPSVRGNNYVGVSGRALVPDAQPLFRLPKREAGLKWWRVCEGFMSATGLITLEDPSSCA